VPLPRISRRILTQMGVVDPAGPVWDRLAAEEKRIRAELAQAPDRRSKRGLKRRLRRAQQQAIADAHALRRGSPPGAVH